VNEKIGVRREAKPRISGPARPGPLPGRNGVEQGAIISKRVRSGVVDFEKVHYSKRHAIKVHRPRPRARLCIDRRMSID